MAQPVDKKELWVGWTRDAMLKYAPPENDKIDTDGLVDDMVDVTTKYADAMLDEFEERFEGVERAPRTRGKRKKPADDEED